MPSCNAAVNSVFAMFHRPRGDQPRRPGGTALTAGDRARLERVRQDIAMHGGVAEIFVADVTRENEVASLAEAVKARFGNPQILINNAGINLRKNLVDFTLEEFRSVLDASLISTFLMCRALVPGMRGTGYGRILNMSSIMSHVSLAGRGAYSSAKTALLRPINSISVSIAVGSAFLTSLA